MVALASQAMAFAPPQVFENTVISRSIDVTGSYVRETVSLTIKNIGDEAQSVYYFALDPESYSNIAVFEGRERGKKPGLIDVFPSEHANDEENVNYYELNLLNPLKPGQETVLQLGIAVVNKIFPSPKYAAQSDTQALAIKDSRFTLSAYKTLSQSLKINTIGLNFDDITADFHQTAENARAEAAGEEPFNLIPEVDGKFLKYGPYKGIPAYTTSPLIVKYEFPRPVVKTAKLERDVWISHWGATISFEEYYEIHHFGTRLQDGFSRLDYVRPQNSYNLNMAAVKSFEISLPEDVRGVYFTDLVGNVSTSTLVAAHDDTTSLILKPRYPLFGGWNYNFTIGWSVDLSEYLMQPDVTNDPETYILRVPLIDGPVEMPYDEVVINIVLPEGATDIDLAALHPTVPEALYITKSYLDFAGRPSIQLVYNNIIDNYRRTHVFVTYKYVNKSLYRKPLVVSGIFGAFFTFFFAISKIDLSISAFKPKKAKKN